MINVAVLGYGTIGAGVVEVLQKNAESIAKKAGQEIVVKRILDLRDFPGDPNADLVVHDYKIIEEDPDIKVVVECMGGLKPAYDFVKTALEQGRSVATSNKELVAKHGSELIKTAKDHKCNFLFEASVGGGIPIIRPLTTCLTGDVIEEISGILNGTTNFMLTKMDEEGYGFDEILKVAQDLGYAELHPEADVEGFDACRKIAILTSLANGMQVDFEDIYTEGITKITKEDFVYAKKMKRGIKLIAQSWKENGNTYAMVAPMLVEQTHPLYCVRDVFNAVFVHGNMVDDTMFYGKGAGKLPTASAVVADVVDCVKHTGINVKLNWLPDKLEISDIKGCTGRFFVRMSADVSKEAIAEAFGAVDYITVDEIKENAFVTPLMTEGEFREAKEKFDTEIRMIRIKE